MRDSIFILTTKAILILKKLTIDVFIFFFLNHCHSLLRGVFEGEIQSGSERRKLPEATCDISKRKKVR